MTPRAAAAGLAVDLAFAGDGQGNGVIGQAVAGGEGLDVEEVDGWHAAREAPISPPRRLSSLDSTPTPVRLWLWAGSRPARRHWSCAVAPVAARLPPTLTKHDGRPCSGNARAGVSTLRWRSASSMIQPPAGGEGARVASRACRDHVLAHIVGAARRRSGSAAGLGRQAVFHVQPGVGRVVGAHIEAPSEAMLTVSSPSVSAAASTAILSAGTPRFSATRSPAWRRSP